MSLRLSPSRPTDWRPWIATVLVLGLAVAELRLQGRLWLCACGQVRLWAGDIWSNENSQQLFDPYTFTHVLHGFIICGLLALVAPRLAPAWRLCATIGIEALWEIFENSAFIIQRYREATLALGYEGDTVLNSFGDILACGVGFLIARRVGWRWALAIFIGTELVLMLWIKDSLLLNLIMLIYPVEAIKRWQMGQ